MLSNVEKASRIIYLNKTCYNGLFRVNSSGEFNSPFGRYKNPKIVEEITIKAISHYFNTNDIEILSTDYKKALLGVKKEVLFILILLMILYLIVLILQDTQNLALQKMIKLN